MDNKQIMKIVEISTIVNNEGKIIINKNMGFKVGERVWFTYLTPADGIENVEYNFVITPKRLENMENVLIEDNKVEFEVPEELLECAGIENSADVEIICENKQIILRENLGIPEQIFEICERLGIEREKVETILKEENSDGR